MASPVVAGLDEEIAQMEASQQRANENSSAAASPSSLQGGSSWSAKHQNDWVKHESFVHKLESLLHDEDEREDGQRKDEIDGILNATSSGEEEGEDDEEMAKVGTDDVHQKALRRRRKLLKLKQRYARRKSLPPSSSSSLPMHDEEQEQLNEADDEVLTAAAALQWAASNSSPILPDTDDQKGSTSRSTSPSAPPSTTTSAEAGTEEDEDFYDAQAGPSTSPSLHIHSHVRKMNIEDDEADEQANEMSWLQMSPRPNATASSATLRQDAMEGALGSQDGSGNQLHHQASTATLSGIVEDGDPEDIPISESGKRASQTKVDQFSRRRSSVLPPAAPHPTTPLPSTPSSFSHPISPVTLGPNGTIRGGRPRGATVGAVPGAHGNVRPRIRPRSLLSNELLLAGNDISISSVSTKFNLSSSTSSESSAMRTSSILPSYPTEEFLHSATLTSTPSSSAASIGSSSAIGDASGSKASLAVESRSRSGSGTGLLQHIQSRPRSQANFVIAVVGHKSSGKSTVIRKGLRQFGLSKPTVVSDRITSHSTICIVDQKERTIEVLEMDASVLLNGPSRRFAWPRSLPYIDAAILCYDASQISSFRGMSELLENFAMNQLSTVMLACKSEISPKAVDPYYASDMASVYNVGLAECSVQSEEGKKRMRDCFSYLVKEVAKGRATMRISETGSTSGPATRTPISPLAAQSVSNKDSSTMNAVSPDYVPHPSSDSGHTGNRSPSSSTAAPSIHMRDRQSVISRKKFDRKMSDVTIGSIEAGSEEDGGAFQQSINRAQLGLQSAKSVGGYVSIEELWDKLFFSAVSGNDDRFLHMFMTFFRGFARPIDLLNQIVVRFDALARGEKSDGVMIRYSLMKLTTMLGDWMQEYPGDLSDSETFSILVDFYDRLLVHPATTHIAAPMQPLLDVVRSAPDLDAIWSKDQDNDKPRSVAADVPPVKPYDTRSRAPSTSSNSAAAVAISRLHEGGRGTSETHTTANSDATTAASSVASHGQHSTSESIRGNRRRSTSDVTTISSEGHRSANSSAAMSASTGAGGMSGNGSSQYLGNSGQLPGIGVPKGPVTVQMQKAILRNTSNMLFEIRDEDIAHELTRIEWDLFCTIGPRDLLRHILVSRSLRAPNSSVAQSIAHFNYISAWVCSLVLVQSKAKQRARMLEKFMEVATILRRTNNYNTLHAILAGLGNASIHRLKNTRELLNGKKVMKQYQSLTRLMGSERSFAAYRLALENSEGRTIPYLGVHLQDILSTSDGNPSKRANDGMIHWRKFNLMYDAVMAIVRCQQYQMPLRENTTLAQMIVDLPVWDEEAQYQRSLQVEQRQSSAVSGSTGSRIIKQLLKTNT